LGTGLQHEKREILTATLISNTDLFAWLSVDLPGVDPQVAIDNKLDNAVVDAIKLILLNYSNFSIAKIVVKKIERVK